MYEFKQPDFDSSKPLSAQVAGIIEAKILEGRIGVGEKIAPQEELRKTFGVALVTVKTALADLTRQGYISRRPKHGTFVISSGRDKTASMKDKNIICLVICTGREKQTLGNKGFYILTNSVEGVAKEEGLQMVYKTLNGEDSLDFGRNENDIAGLVLAGNITRRHLRLVKNTRLPFVMIGDVFERTLENDIDVISSGDFQGAYTATKYLIGRGHSKIAYFMPRMGNYPFVREYIDGYKQALKDSKIKFDKTLLARIKGGNAAYRDIRSFIAKNPCFTAMICVSDFEAVREVLREKNMKLPADIIVETNDPSALYAVVAPDPREIARASVDRILSHRTPGWKPERIVVPFKLTEKISQNKIAI